MREIRELASQIRDKRKIMQQEGSERRGVQKPRLPRGVKARSQKDFLDEMNGLGIEVDDSKQHFKRTKSRGRSLVKKVGGRELNLWMVVIDDYNCTNCGLQ